ncbi:MAG: redoxin domain-containing protein [Planctomycetes bacterium]|nr:redoxin domain-containing protein [Planctomycetota bacterium]
MHRVLPGFSLALLLSMNARAQEPAPPAPEPLAEPKAQTEPQEQTEPRAQTEPVAQEGHSLHGQAFDSGPRQAALLLPGMPSVRFPVTTSSSEAQAFFEQGIGQFHGFWFFEAERSFRQAAALDPSCAMAYWGMSLANFDNDKGQDRARGFAAEALRRRDQASERERRWIDAWAALYELDAAQLPAPRAANAAEIWKAKRSEKERRRELVRKLEEIVRAEPENIEALALLAVTIWFNTDHGHSISSHQPIDFMLDRVFAAAPLHPAHHYRIHLWDNEKAELALRSAVLSGPSGPGIAHLWHMGGHIFDELQRPREAAWLQEASSRVDHAAMQRDRVMPFLIHNYGHNQEWLSRSCMQLGRRSDALRIAANLLELPRHPRWNRPEQARDIAWYAPQRALDVVERFEDWEALERLVVSGHLLLGTGDRALRASAHGLFGRAAAQRSALDEAERARAAIVALRDEERAARFERAGAAEDAALAEKGDEEKVHEAMKKALREHASAQRAIESELAFLEAWMALARGEKDAARAHFERANIHQPYPAADFLRALGDLEKALAKIDEGLGKAKRDAALLARRLRLLHELGRTDELGAAFDALASATPGADLEAPLFASLAPIAAACERAADWRWNDPWPEDFERPVELPSLGPLTWSPYLAPSGRCWNEEGLAFELDEWRGKPVVLIFFLGFDCLHCVEQLRALRPLAKSYREAGIELLAIGTDGVAELKSDLAALAEEERFPFPIYADPDLEAFRAYRAYDDFEKAPLHGTFLVDARGRVRWQDVGAEPFLELEFLREEAQRLLRLESAPAEEASGAGSSQR